MVEKPKITDASSNIAIVERYILTSDIFDKILETEPCVDGEFQITDALAKLNEV